MSCLCAASNVFCLDFLRHLRGRLMAHVEKLEELPPEIHCQQFAQNILTAIMLYVCVIKIIKSSCCLYSSRVIRIAVKAVGFPPPDDR